MFQSKLDDYQERMNKGERLNQDQLVKSTKKKPLSRSLLNCFIIFVERSFVLPLSLLGLVLKVGYCGV